MARYLIEYTIGEGFDKQTFADEHTASDVKYAVSEFCYNNCCDQPEILSVSLVDEFGIGTPIPESEWKWWA